MSMFTTVMAIEIRFITYFSIIDVAFISCFIILLAQFPTSYEVPKYILMCVIEYLGADVITEMYFLLLYIYWFVCTYLRIVYVCWFWLKFCRNLF